MDLRLLVHAAWKQKWIVLIAVVAGLLLAFMTLYRIDVVREGDGRSRLAVAERSYTVYESQVQLMLFDPLFGVSRAGQDSERPDSFRRTVELAPTYAYLAVGEAVRAALEASVGLSGTSLSCQSVEKSPLLVVNVTGSDEAGVVRVASSVGSTFQEYLRAQQDTYGVPVFDRMAVRQVAEPTPLSSVVSRNIEIAAVALLAPLLIVLAVIYTREGLRRDQAAASGQCTPVAEPSPAPTIDAEAEDRPRARPGRAWANRERRKSVPTPGVSR
jgi:hypothetical protein